MPWSSPFLEYRTVPVMVSTSMAMTSPVVYGAPYGTNPSLPSPFLPLLE